MPVEITKEQRELLLRKALFVPCETKEDLHRWIKIYLNVDLPDCTVDPESTSNPMDLVWEVYSKARAGDPDFGSVLAYAARATFKTLGASILELLFILHLQRNVGHMAAIETQAHIAAGYLKQFTRKPYIKEYVTKENARSLEITKYKRGSDYLNTKQYEALPDNEKNDCEYIKNEFKIVIASIEGANGLHAPLLILDELDIAPEDAVEESRMIPVAGPNGEPSITFMTSTRKYNVGLVQKEIDKAQKAKPNQPRTAIRHWNIIDVTQSCPAERHLPELPKIPVYVSREDLRAIPEDEWKLLSGDEKARYERDEGYVGCLRNCSLYAMCRGRLATEQKSKSTALKQIREVQQRFADVSVEVAKAQLLCWKPSSEGMIYSKLNRSIHCLLPHQMARALTGHDYPANFSKAQLIQLFQELGCSFYGGIDHGFTHNFACVIGAIDGNRLFIIDVISEPELELSQKIDRCKERFEALGIRPKLYADSADPASNTTMAKYFNLVPVEKKADSVVEGIQIVRLKLTPAGSRPPELYFLAGDPGVEFLVDRMSTYRWKIDNAGNVTKDPEKKEDDECDACRYLVMSAFNNRGMVVVATNNVSSEGYNQTPTEENWMTQKIDELTGGNREGVDGVQSLSKTGKFFIG